VGNGCLQPPLQVCPQEGLFGRHHPILQGGQSFVQTALSSLQHPQPLAREGLTAHRPNLPKHLNRLAQGFLGSGPLHRLELQGPVKGLAQADGAGRTHAAGLLQSGLNGGLKLIIGLITIQVILPQSQMDIKGIGHIQVGADQG
jgi:hypothetical protein